MCAFGIYQKTISFLALYTEEVNANFCHGLMQNHLSKLPMHKSLILVIFVFELSDIFTFSHSKKRMQIMKKSVGQVTLRRTLNKFRLFGYSESFTILL